MLEFFVPFSGIHKFMFHMMSFLNAMCPHSSSCTMASNTEVFPYTVNSFYAFVVGIDETEEPCCFLNTKSIHLRLTSHSKVTITMD